MIDQLLASLRSVDLRPTAEELAEALWLAQYLPAAARPVEPTRPPPRQAEPERPRVEEPPPPGQQPEETRPTPPPGASQTPEGAKLVRPELPQDSGEASVRGSLVRAPAAAALPHALKLGHAFRPLRRRVPSRTRFVLDEAATVYQVAETQGLLWSPVFTPARTRWMELALVVDGSASMGIWAQTISELERLLERLGAFRDVRRWTLETADPRGVHLYAGHGAPVTRAARPLRELIDPTGLRLVLVVSDCIAPAWNTGAVMQALSVWGSAGPVALVQVLPQRLWVRTGLGVAVRTPLRARSRGAANIHLEPERRVRSRHGPAVQGLPLPVFPLDPPSIAEWARMLAGGGTAAPGLVLPPSPWEGSEADTPPEPPLSEGAIQLNADGLIQGFQGTASPLAQELASLLSAAPLYLPAMRLVQRVMLPEARQVHLAEVLLGGLLKEVKGKERPSWGSEAWYEFLPGVRQRLLDSLKRGSALDVLRQVSDFIGVRFGQGRDFAAALVAPEGDLQLDAGEANEPFAMVATTVLRRLGGRYARLAERLQSVAPGPREEVRQEPTPAPSEPPVPQSEEERIRQACALVFAGTFMTNAYLVEPRRFITSAGGLQEAGTGERVRVHSARGWHEATVLGMDFRSDCAVVEVDEALGGITPLELAEVTAVTDTNRAVEVYGLQQSERNEPWVWKSAGLVMRGPNRSLLLGLEEESPYEELLTGMPVLKGGRVVGHVSVVSWKGKTSTTREVCSAQQVRKLLSPGNWKPRGQQILVAGTGDVDRLTPEIIQSSQALGAKLAREGYGLVGGGWPGVDEHVGRAYLASLRLIGAKPEELFLQVVESGLQPALEDGALQRTAFSDNVEVALRSADAVILIGGAAFTHEIYERTRAEGKPVFPLPSLGGTAADSYQLLIERWKRSPFGGLARRDLESLNHPVRSRADAEELANRTAALVARALAAQLKRSPEFASAMLDLLLVTEPLILDLRPTKRAGAVWMKYARDLMESMGRPSSNLPGMLLERMGHLVVSSGTAQDAQFHEALTALRKTLPASGPWLLTEFSTLARIEEQDDLRWRLLVQLTPLVLETRGGLTAVASVLKQMELSASDAFEQILSAVKDQFDTSEQFNAWLSETFEHIEKEKYPSLRELASAYLLIQDDEAAKFALAQLREELKKVSLRGLRWARLSSWMESSDAARQLLAHLMVQINPEASFFKRMVEQFRVQLEIRQPLFNARGLEVLLTSLIVVIEATGVPNEEPLSLMESIQRALSSKPSRWAGSQNKKLMRYLHMLQVLCGETAQPIPGLVLVGPRLVVMGNIEKRTPRHWNLTPGTAQSGEVSSWKDFVSEFKSLQEHDQFIAFEREARLVKRGGMSAKRVGAWQLSFEVAEEFPKMTFVNGGERVGEFITKIFSHAFSATGLWERLHFVASQLPASQSWELMLNNLLRLEATRLAALPAHPLDVKSQKTALRCINRVWNVVALRGDSSDKTFEAGMVLDIHGYGPWAGIVQLTRERPSQDDSAWFP